jgi:hypothetical protein
LRIDPVLGFIALSKAYTLFLSDTSVLAWRFSLFMPNYFDAVMPDYFDGIWLVWFVMRAIENW